MNVRILGLWMFCLVLGFAAPVHAEPASGSVSGPAAPLVAEIVVGSDHSAWMRYDQGGPFFMCGPGNSEGFLHRGTRKPDGTRSGDQLRLINKLGRTGANSIYLMAVRSHGGDGARRHNPFIDSKPANGLHEDILSQWETWFAKTDEEGIVIFFIFYDDGARIRNTGSIVGAAERAFIHTLVDRFEYHRHLIWMVAEECQEAYRAARIANIAAEIRAADDHGHVIAVHKRNGLDFSEFANDPNLDQFAIQYNVSTAHGPHRGVVRAWNKAAGRYGLNLAEASLYGTGAAARRKNWPVALGGAHAMVPGWTIDTTAIRDLKDCGGLRRFMESTTFNAMSPHDELRHDGTQYVLALPSKSYYCLRIAAFWEHRHKGYDCGEL